MNATPSHRRVRQGLRRAAIIAFALLVPVAAHALWDYIELRRLVQEIDAIKSRGEPVTELQAAGGYHQMTAEEELPGRMYLAAGMLAHPVVRKDRRAASAGPSASALSLLHQYLAGRARPDFDLMDVTRRLEQVTSEGADALALVDRATTLRFFGFPPGTTYSYRSSELIGLLELLSVRAAHHSLRGDAEQAVDSSITLLNAREALAAGDWFVASVGVGRREVETLLTFATPSSAALKNLQARVAAGEQDGDITAQVIKHRASFIDLTFRQFYGGDAAVPQTYRLPYRSFTFYVWRPLFTRDIVAALRGWNAYVEASREPWPEKGRAMAAAYARFFAPIDRAAEARTSRFWSRPRHLRFVPFMTPTFRTTRSAYDVTMTRAAVAAIAVARHRTDHGGALPRTLDELTPLYLTTVPLDPATGRPLLYTHDGDRAFTVYGVGQDGADNGGDVSAPRGSAPRIPEGNDVGIRVLLHLRQQETHQ